MWDSGVCHGAGFSDPDGNAILLHHRYKPYGAGLTLGQPPVVVRRPLLGPEVCVGLVGLDVSSSALAPCFAAASFTAYTTSKPPARLPTMTIAHGPSPAPTKVCRVQGGQWTKSHAFRRRSSPSITRMHSPETTRKSSWPLSPWYEAVLAGPENLDAEAELMELLLPFEVGVLPAVVAPDPGRVAGVEHEPAVALGHEPELGLRQLRLGNGVGHAGTVLHWATALSRAVLAATWRGPDRSGPLHMLDRCYPAYAAVKTNVEKTS